MLQVGCMSGCFGASRRAQTAACPCDVCMQRWPRMQGLACAAPYHAGGRLLLRAPGGRRLLGDGFYEVTQCMWRPSAKSSTPDAVGRLWGWENSRSCTFRFGSRPVFYTGYEPGDWVLTPACTSRPFAPDSVTVRQSPPKSINVQDEGQAVFLPQVRGGQACHMA